MLYESCFVQQIFSLLYESCYVQQFFSTLYESCFVQCCINHASINKCFQHCMNHALYNKFFQCLKLGSYIVRFNIDQHCTWLGLFTVDSYNIQNSTLYKAKWLCTTFKRHQRCKNLHCTTSPLYEVLLKHSGTSYSIDTII